MDYISPLIIGLMGGFHCMGMCGPIALALPLKENSWGSRVFSAFLYNAGRTVTYGFLGLLFGLLGFGIHLWGVQQWVSIGLGTIMILSVGFPILFHGSKVTGLLDPLFSGLTKNFRRFFGIRTYSSVMILGLLNGLLPCGLVYIALAGALVANSPADGAIYMVIFGAGTIPSLMLLSLAGHIVPTGFRARMRSMIPYLVLLIGILFVLRGMNLGIPYLSPKMEPVKPKSEQFQKPDCCH